MVIQAWYADDASALYYFSTAGKPDLLLSFCQVSSDTCVNVTADGRPYLGAAIGSRSYVSDYASGKVSS